MLGDKIIIPSGLYNMVSNSVGEYCSNHNLRIIPVRWGTKNEHSGMEYNIDYPEILISVKLPEQLKEFSHYDRVRYVIGSIRHELIHYTQYLELKRRNIPIRKELFDEKEAYDLARIYANNQMPKYTANEINPILYQKKLKDLITKTEQSGIKVDFVGTKTLKDYLGMNTEAARDMGYPLGNKTIHISKSASAKDKYDTLKHELYEMEQMKKGESYWKAHVKALARENPMAKIRKKRKLTVYNRFMRESMTYWISQGYSAKDAMRKAANEWGNKKLGEPEHNPIDGNTKKYLMYGAVIIGAILLWRRSQSNA